MLGEQLRAWGVATEEATDAPSALLQLGAAAESGAPHHAVVVNARMGGTDGVELARSIAADPALAGIPLVTLSFSGQPAAPGAEITTWLLKPMRPTRLLDALSEALDDTRGKAASAAALTASHEGVSAGVTAPTLSTHDALYRISPGRLVGRLFLDQGDIPQATMNENSSA
jgi:CheY-like chemotaxis protein